MTLGVLIHIKVSHSRSFNYNNLLDRFILLNAVGVLKIKNTLVEKKNLSQRYKVHFLLILAANITVQFFSIKYLGSKNSPKFYFLLLGKSARGSCCRQFPAQSRDPGQSAEQNQERILNQRRSKAGREWPWSSTNSFRLLVKSLRNWRPVP